MLDIAQIQALDDEEFSALYSSVIGDQQRRTRLAQAPADIANMVRQFQNDGGDPDVLAAAIDPAPVTPEE